MGSSNEDIVIAVQTANFKCELDEGASEVASNDKKFEMNFDFRDFKREDIKITISKTIIKIVANSETEFETSEFDEDIEIPARVLRETITCKINKKGVLRISAPLQPDTQEITSRTTSEKVTTQKRVVEGASKSVTTKAASQEEESDEEEEVDATAISTSKVVAKKTEEKKVVVKQEKKIDRDGNILMKPNKVNFTIDAKLITETPEFKKPEVKVGSINRLLSAYLKCTQYKPEEINVKISKSIIRVECRHESKTEKRSFFKEFNVPKGIKHEDIECEINESGILRITVPESTETQTVETQQTTTKSDDVFIMAPKKINFDCPPQEDISVAKDLSFSHLNEKTVQMFANVSQYSTDEVLIRKTRRTIQMEGRHESNTATRAFYKEISIPADVDGNAIDCAINQNGIIRFTATKIKTTKTMLQPKMMGSSTTRTVTTSSSSSGQVVTGSGGPMTGNFGVNVVAQGYTPEEIKVSIADGWITINAKKEARIFGGDSSFRNRSFTKKIQIPPHINPESLVFSLDDNTGALSIASQ